MAQKFVLLLAVLAASGCASLPTSQWAGDGKIVQTANGLCKEMTPESVQHRVAICESPDQKSFAVLAPGRPPTVFPKKAARTLLRERLSQFLRSTPYPPQELLGATVELWVVAPVFAPEEAYFTAFVQAKGGNFTVRLSLDAQSWAPEEKDVALLGKDAYPSRAPRRAGRVVVTARPHVSEADFQAFLAANGLKGEGAGGSIELRTGPFGEESAARVLLKARQAKYFVQSVELEPAGERDGAKARALAFPLGGS